MTKRILIIDDEYRIREVVKMSLEMMAGWTALIASSGNEGLAIAIAQQPDAIILDMMMPEMDGIETLTQLRVNSQTENIPVLLLTAKFPPIESEQIEQLKVTAVIEKPFDPLGLPNLITQALNW